MTSLHIMDNEALFFSVTNYLEIHNIKHQLVPPHVHQCNVAERAISTSKDHYIAGLCTTDPQFPMHLWDLLLPQCDYTLNMIRASRLHPTLSVYTNYTNSLILMQHLWFHQAPKYPFMRNQNNGARGIYTVRMVGTSVPVLSLLLY